MSEWPRILNDDGMMRLEQTQPPNSYLVVKRNEDDSEVVSQPTAVTEPKDEIIRLLHGALLAALRERDLR